MTTREVAIPASSLKITVPIGDWAAGYNEFSRERQTALSGPPDQCGSARADGANGLQGAQGGSFQVGLPDSAQTELFEETGGGILEPCVATASVGDTACGQDLTGDGRIDDR